MSLHFKRWTAYTLALAVFSMAVSVCSADGKKRRPPMDPDGEPAGLRKGTTECYKVWHNATGWHMHAVNAHASRDHRYQGTITVEGGIIENIQTSLPKKTGQEGQWKHRSDRTSVSFDFVTPEKEDGINFKISKGATAVRFSLKIDGKDAPDQIFVGKRGDNPDSSTFTLAAHPGRNNPEQVTSGATKSGIK